MSNRVGMIYKLRPQKLEEVYKFDKISSDDINRLSVAMLEAFEGTEDFNGETLDDLNKEIYSVVESTFGTFIPKALVQNFLIN